MSNEVVKVILVDDVESIHEALREYIEGELGFSIIAEAYNGEEFLALADLSNADVVLMDIEMPVLNGLEATKQALWRFRQLNVIAITMYQEKAYLKSLIEAGFKGCVFKQNMFNELEPAIQNVRNGGLYFPSSIMLNV